MLSQICVKKHWQYGRFEWWEHGEGWEVSLRGLHSSPIRQGEAKTMAMESERGWDGEVFMKYSG